MNSLKVFLLIFLSIQSIYAADLTANLFSKCQWRWGTDFAGTNKNYAAYDYITMWLGVIYNFIYNFGDSLLLRMRRSDISSIDPITRSFSIRSINYRIDSTIRSFRAHSLI